MKMFSNNEERVIKKSIQFSAIQIEYFNDVIKKNKKTSNENVSF